MVTIREEAMGPHFTKYHIEGLPFAAVIHRFTETDHGDPHDHPWGFPTFILKGGYVEEIFNLDGTSYLRHNAPGDTVYIEAKHIHRIVELPDGECWTLILPDGPATMTSGFYKFIEGMVLHRPWDREDFQPLER